MADPLDSLILLVLNNPDQLPHGNDILPGDWVWSSNGYYALVHQKNNEGNISIYAQVAPFAPMTVQRQIGPPVSPIITGTPTTGSTLTTPTVGTYYRWKIDGVTVSTVNSLSLVGGMENKQVILYVNGAPSLPASITLFNPIPSLAPSLWLDYADASTLFSNSGTTLAQIGDRVLQWNDKSGNALHAFGNGANGGPLRQADGLMFDGISDFMSHSLESNGEVTVFVVANRTATDDSIRGLFSAKYSGDASTAILLSDSGIGTEWGTIRGGGATGSGYPLTSSKAVLMLYGDAGSVTLQHNKRALYTALDGAFDDGNYRQEIGRSGPGDLSSELHQGLVCEIIVLPYIAIPAQIIPVQDYLIAKWNIVTP